ncbi:MAG: SprT-like domain-containing protein [Pseudomonadota bacterium]
MPEPQLSLPFDALADECPETRPANPNAVTEYREAPLDTAAAEAPLLDSTIVSVIVLREVDRALARYPEWTHPFAGLSFNRARRSYGQAHRDGRIVISTVFFGTAALDDLEDTVRHEIAHLIVGIDARHGPRWRKVARALGAIPRAAGRSSCESLNARMDDAPYTLVAVLTSGEECEVKSVYRRSRRYQDYRLGERGAHYRYRGESVLRFEFRERRGASTTATGGS